MLELCKNGVAISRSALDFLQELQCIFSIGGGELPRTGTSAPGSRQLNNKFTGLLVGPSGLLWLDRDCRGGYGKSVVERIWISIQSFDHGLG